MESKEERLLKAIFSENEDPNDNYPETYAEKAGYAEHTLTYTLQDISTALWRLSRLDKLLFAAEKDGKNTLPNIITNNEVRMALTPILRVENDVNEIAEMLTNIYIETKQPEGAVNWCPTENAVLRRELRKLTAQLASVTAERDTLKEQTADARLQLRTATFSTDKGAADLAKFILSILPEAPKEDANG